MLELQLELVHRIGVLEPMGIQVHHLFPGEKANICDDYVQRHEKDSGPVERSPAQLMRVNKNKLIYSDPVERPPAQLMRMGKRLGLYTASVVYPSLPKVCTQLLGANHGSSGSGSAGSSMVHLERKSVIPRAEA